MADAKPTPDSNKVTYEDDVKPIFRAHCSFCHNQSDKDAGLALDSYAGVLEGGGSGEIVSDNGDAESSRLWQLMNHDDTPVMPPSGTKIPQAQLDIVRAWIEGGILENSGSKAKIKPKNALAYVAATSGRPEGAPPMPNVLPQRVPVVSDRASATTAIGCSPWAPLVAIAGQQQICLYHSDTGELLGILPFEEGIPQSLRFSQDGRYLIAGGGEHSVRGIAAIYQIKDGKRMATIGDELDVVFDADASADLSSVAMGGPQKMLRIYDATDGALKFDLKKHTDWIYAVAYSPDGVLIASSDRSGGLCIWEADTGRLFLDLAGHKGAVMSLAWRDDSNVLASAGDDGTVKLWDMVAGKLIKSFQAHAPGVTAVRFDHKGQLATAGKDSCVRVWDAGGKRIFQTPALSEAVLEVGITHDSSRVVYGDWSGEIQTREIGNRDQTLTLAANPRPAKIRAEEIDRTISELQVELAPLKSDLQKAEQTLAAKTATMQQVQAEIKKATELVAEHQTKIKTIDEQAAASADRIRTLTQQSRGSHDRIVAARLGLAGRSEPKLIEDLTKLETEMASQLTQLVEMRRLELGFPKAKQQAEKQLGSAVKSLDELRSKSLVAAQQAVAMAKTELERCTKAMQPLQAEIQQHHEKKSLLLTAMQ